MLNRFDSKAAADLAVQYPGLRPELLLRLYTSRLLGQETDLVLHGGGNTSVKIEEKDLTGRNLAVLYVKASGTDLGLMRPNDLVPLDLAALVRLESLAMLSDEDMANQLLTSRLRATDPAPSIDAWAHAFLPYRYMDHTHADVILILTNQERGSELVKEVLGPRVAVCPYTRPGFALGRAVSRVLADKPDAEAVVVLGHGIFTYSDQADIAYHRMIGYVDRAEKWLAAKIKPNSPGSPPPEKILARVAQIFRGTCAHASPDGSQRRFIVDIRSDPDLVAASLDPAAAEWCRSGVLTPDHVIRTKNQALYLDEVPEDEELLQGYIRKSVQEYLQDYECYFTNGRAVVCVGPPKPEDPYPRVCLAAGLGIMALGYSRREARVAADIAAHTFRAKMKARAIGQFQPISLEHIYDMEYWPL
ncbi:MAG: class II aldolase/adducin family protein [Deltaproteobacteria bacterium]|nr:class II aldolase/adducin family protein [Deltaproteobacteria bacterium]